MILTLMLAMAIEGHKILKNVYYSETGQPGSWVRIESPLSGSSSVTKSTLPFRGTGGEAQSGMQLNAEIYFLDHTQFDELFELCATKNKKRLFWGFEFHNDSFIVTRDKFFGRVIKEPASTWQQGDPEWVLRVNAIGNRVTGFDSDTSLIKDGGVLLAGDYMFDDVNQKRRASNTGSNIFLAMAEFEDFGTSEEFRRGVAKINPVTGDIEFNPLQIVSVIDQHFNPSLWVERGQRITMLGAWWSGTINNDYMSMFVSDNPEDVSSFGSEMQIPFDDTSITNVAVTYPSIVRAAGNVMVYARLPQSSADRSWGFKTTDKYPFEPGDLTATTILIDTDEWWYIESTHTEGPFVYFTMRAHGTNNTDRTSYFFIVDFENGDIQGPGGIIGNIFTGTGLPFVKGDLWQITGDEDWTVPIDVFTRSLAPFSPVVAFLERVDTSPNVYEVMVWDLQSDTVIKTGKLSDSIRATTVETSSDLWKIIFLNQDGHLEEIESTDKFETFESRVIQRDVNLLNITKVEGDANPAITNIFREENGGIRIRGLRR
jgi:hypothetical protein